MSWYYYSGRIVRSIPVSRNKSVAVRPNTKVEILEITQEAQAMMRSGDLKRTGKPLGAVSLGDLPPRPLVKMRDVVPPSALAQHFAEKGVTPSRDMPPQKPVGAQEFTVHELAAKGIVHAPRPEPVAPAAPMVDDPVAEAADAADADPAAEDGGRRSKRRHGH